MQHNPNTNLVELHNNWLGRTDSVTPSWISHTIQRQKLLLGGHGKRRQRR